jgi:glycine oxidase
MERMSSEIVIVGGGVIGCAIARELAGAGCRVTLLERERIAGEASSAAAGILCSQLEAETPSPLVGFGMESLRGYADFVEALRQETGIDPELDTRGILMLDMTREDAAGSERLLAWQSPAGLPVEKVSSGEIAGLEEGLGTSLLGGLMFPRGGRVDPGILTRALAASARSRGARIREGCPIASLIRHGDRVAGVILEGGERVAAERVILAAGAWSARLLPEVKVEIFPVRGQILILDAPQAARRHVLVTPRVYLVYRRDGTVLVGSTLEKVGFRKAVTPKAMLRLLASALVLDPQLEEAELAGSWSGLRPGTTDELPLIGPVGEGLWLATGHYRNGILLAPLTSALTTEWVLRGTTSRLLDPYSPLRTPATPTLHA